jgi:hypothetical protein
MKQRIGSAMIVHDRIARHHKPHIRVKSTACAFCSFTLVVSRAINPEHTMTTGDPRPYRESQDQQKGLPYAVRKQHQCAGLSSCVTATHSGAWEKMRTPAAQFPFGPALKENDALHQRNDARFQSVVRFIMPRTANHYNHDISLRLTAVFYPGDG